ncbi:MULTISPECIES: hypothetical protein [unclassified Streptomyces]|uniref:hypothetical protein n=1 Tax=unclassified Streptomyces TaxID=2593676 RepID=UPI00081BB782|nr:MULTISPECIES: hypothetical protein [unclassified Streptomyces]MYY17938.1 hypothetical protein [Streptomyces sp. SID4912]SCD94462.1 hypothetical protein GA0115241_108540 [Streptomyces sp. DpondAA-D4]
MPTPALELPLPDPVTLSDAQQRGANCVWCAAPLANTAAHDLGARPLDAHGVSVLWFPRCCRTCWKARS